MLSKLNKIFSSPKHCVLAFFLISIILYSIFIFILNTPFSYDEGTYSLMVKEFTDNPTRVMPTVTGVYVGWKPPLFTWVYSIFYFFLKNFNFSPETTMRLPSAFFGALCVSFIYLIANKLYGVKVAFASAMLSITTPGLIFASSLIMMEAFSLFLILAAIYFYLRKNFLGGMFFLFLLVLTKWLYVIVPILFVLLYFLKDKDLKKIIASFFVVPISIAIYFVIASLFADVNSVFLNYSLDISRITPSLDLLVVVLMSEWVFFFLFPMSCLFVFFLFSKKFDLWKDKHLLATALLAFMFPLFQHPLFWYAIISLPTMIILVSKKMCEILNDDKLLIFLLFGMLFINAEIFVTYPFSGYDEGTKDIANFMKGKNVAFFETHSFYSNWEQINLAYINTSKSYLLLEQIHPGILFYRFNDTDDYYNLHAVFARNEGAIDCHSEYLVVHGENITVPECFELIFKKSKFSVYTVSNSAS